MHYWVLKGLLCKLWFTDHTEWTPEKPESSDPSLISWAAAGWPHSEEEFKCKPDDHHDFLVWLFASMKNC